MDSGASEPRGSLCQALCVRGTCSVPWVCLSREGVEKRLDMIRAVHVHQSSGNECNRATAPRSKALVCFEDVDYLQVGETGLFTHSELLPGGLTLG